MCEMDMWVRFYCARATTGASAELCAKFADEALEYVKTKDFDAETRVTVYFANEHLDDDERCLLVVNCA